MLCQPVAWPTATCMATWVVAIDVAMLIAMGVTENLCRNARLGLRALAPFAFRPGLPPSCSVKTQPASALSASNPRLYCARPRPASLFRALTGHPLARAKSNSQEAGEDGNWLRALAKGISEDARLRSRARLAAYSLGFPRS